MNTEKNKTANELARYLKAIIDSYEDQNQAIVSLLHSNILTNLSYLQLAMNREFKNSSFSEETYKELVTTIKEVTTDLQRIHVQVFPKILKYIGLKKSIESFCNEYSKKYIIVLSLEDKIHFDSISQIELNKNVNILRLFKAVLIYFICNGGGHRIEINMESSEKMLYFSFNVQQTDLPEIKRDIQEQFFVESIDSIFARIISLNADVDARSDWRKFLAFSIPIE